MATRPIRSPHEITNTIHSMRFSIARHVPSYDLINLEENLVNPSYDRLRTKTFYWRRYRMFVSNARRRILFNYDRVLKIYSKKVRGSLKDFSCRKIDRLLTLPYLRPMIVSTLGRLHRNVFWSPVSFLPPERATSVQTATIASLML